MKLSIISPVYNAEMVLDQLVERIEAAVTKITSDFEIILIEDGSPDKSWIVIEDLAKTRKHVKGIKLSRNFGQHYAISAGIDNCNGDWIVVMDCDLQDQPEEIQKLYNKATEGYDIVYGRRHQRMDGFIKKAFSKFFHKLLSYLTGLQYDSTVANFGIYSKKVIENLKFMNDKIRFFPSMVKWVGFKSASVDIEHAQRTNGSSNYDFKKLSKLALDVILSTSDKPMRLTVRLGIYVAFFALLFGLYVILRAVFFGFSVSGYASIIFSIWFLSGIILATLGIVGLYVGKIFEGVKNRPVYIVEKETQ
ncbi:MAG TPA: glycosyltransferase family 2 protein [Bacteroidia bacterium]|nr:glycosyltransferase family 2 protein [Bacteroidia bacterium]